MKAYLKYISGILLMLFFMPIQAQTVLSDVTAAEYFIDSDPGYGLATQISITPDSLLNLNELFPVTGLTNGHHILGIRAKDSIGNWGITHVHHFLVDNYTTESEIPDIIKVEYFFDHDSGYCKQISLPITPDSLLALNEIIDISALGNGMHFIGIRAGDAYNNWGITHTYRFYVDNYSNVPISDLTEYEYFFNTEPGIGNATPMTLPADTLWDFSETFDLSALPIGSNFLGIRAKNAFSQYGHTYIHNFTKVAFYEIIATTDTGGTINPPDTVYVDAGNNQLYTITPETGFHILDVAVDDASVGPVATYTFNNVNADHTIHAAFEIDTLTITATASANGTITPAGDVEVQYGDNQSFTFTPDANYYVADVLVDGNSIGVVSNYEFVNVTENHTLHVIFDTDTLIIAATASANGTINPAGDVEVWYGNNQNFTFTPDANYYIADVLVDGNSIGIVSNYEFVNVTEDHTIHVIFDIDTLIITATSSANGTINPAGDVEVQYGSNQSFTFTPDANYYIADVLVDGNSIGIVSNYEFVNVTENHSIHVVFETDAFIYTLPWNLYEIKVYPNPVNEYLCIEFESINPNDFYITLFDYNGNILHKTKLSGTGCLKDRVAVNQYSNGIYFITISDNKTFLAKKKILKL
ncbi:MAG: T9SS type A sorting domain-containing protein [Bacteroidales bacterium]|jgi:hypothetical protein|nr:T9SS type A sorting domain-containing protein [Bacteroidales bacterium]MDD4213716.1 T9SS type A sorting domain-containing protein [Bacteroidales bacterium]